jgi:hypothetical protein
MVPQVALAKFVLSNRGGRNRKANANVANEPIAVVADIYL